MWKFYPENTPEGLRNNNENSLSVGLQPVHAPRLEPATHWIKILQWYCYINLLGRGREEDGRGIDKKERKQR
jgi:hypothetical protein